MTTLAGRIRAAFDRVTRPRGSALPPFVLVALLTALAAASVRLIGSVFPAGCTSRVFWIELAFSADRLARLLDARGPCRSAVLESFIPDLLFCVAYPLLLAALFLWVERWRRPLRPSESLDWTDQNIPFRNDALVLAPFVAGALDAFVENASLYWAGTHIPVGATTFSPLVQLLVFVGSSGSAIKWIILLILFPIGFVAEGIARFRHRTAALRLH
jgi:hypothetical protein